MSPGAAARFAVALGVALGLLGVCAGLAAQEEPSDPPPEGPAPEEDAQKTRKVGRIPLPDMTDEELRENGFVWEDTLSRGGSMTAGMIAIIPGALFHGLGHFTLRDEANGWRLLAVEGVGLAIAASGLLVFVTSGSQLAEQGGVGLAQAGGVLFVDSYLADVIGAIKGSRARLSKGVFHQETLEAHAGYRLVQSDDLQLLNLLQVDATVLLGPFSLQPQMALDAQLQYRRLGLDILFKPVEGTNPQDYLGIWTRIDQAVFGQGSLLASLREGTSGDQSVVHFGIGVELGLDMGQLIEHLEHVTTRTVIGIGGANNGGPRAALPGSETLGYFVVENSLSIPLSSELALEPFYVFDEGELLEPLGAFLGVFGARLRANPYEGFEFYLEGAGASGFELAAGLSYYFF